MRRLALLVLCGGCEAVLGLDPTSFSPTTADARPPVDVMPDSCAPDCITFASCAALLQQYPAAPSGVYTLDTGGGTFRAFCELAGDGGGWTLALKVDGRLATFRYDEPIWTDDTLLATDKPALDNDEAKLETFNALAFTQLRVGLEFPIGSGTTRWLVVPAAAARLRDLFAGGQVESALGRDAWKGLIGATASLQVNCNREGINVGNAYSRVRIGIVSNQENDCDTPDSRLGIGGADLNQCTFATPQSAGNSACYTPDNGEIEQAAFGYVMVR